MQLRLSSNCILLHARFLTFRVLVLTSGWTVNFELLCCVTFGKDLYHFAVTYIHMHDTTFILQAFHEKNPTVEEKFFFSSNFRLLNNVLGKRYCVWWFTWFFLFGRWWVYVWRIEYKFWVIERYWLGGEARELWPD